MPLDGGDDQFSHSYVQRGNKKRRKKTKTEQNDAPGLGCKLRSIDDRKEFDLWTFFSDHVRCLSLFFFVFLFHYFFFFLFIFIVRRGSVGAENLIGINVRKRYAEE